jgi:hypothetical protein
MNIDEQGSLHQCPLNNECNSNLIIFLSPIVLRMERRLPMLITARLCHVFQALTVKPGKSSSLGYHKKRIIKRT